MSALTKDERKGLDDIFLSIHVNRSKHRTFKKFISSFASKNISQRAYIFLKRAKNKQKKMKFSHFLTYLPKKKKNLSK